MKVMVIVKATKDSESGVLPNEKMLADMGKFNQSLVEAGVMLAGEGLKPSSEGVRVRFVGPIRSVTAGPFAETNELVAGYWLWNVKSMEDAIEWVKRCPNPMLTDSDIEIRPIFEADDFGEVFNTAEREKESVIRAQTLGLGSLRFENGREMLIAGFNQSYMFVARGSIPFQWQRFAPHIGKVPGQVGKDCYGVCSSIKSNSGFDYLSGVEVSGTAGLPSEFSTVKLPEIRYAVFVHNDHVSKIPKTVDTIWNQWLPESGLKAASSPCFERYTEQFDPKSGMGGTEIWIPMARG